MIKSMTGYGKAQTEHASYSVQVEVKALNSKYLDATVKLPYVLSSKEITVRNLLSDTLQRGKVLIVVDFVGKGDMASTPTINRALLKEYYQVYQEVAHELQENPADLFRIAALSPDIVQSNHREEVAEPVWKAVEKTIRQAITQCDEFRQQEGRALQQDLKGCVGRIRSALEGVEAQVPARDEHVRQRLRHQLDEQIVKELVDENRFEQEMIYYLEKLDVNEEIVRLSNHLKYFSDILQQPTSQGKKMGFVAQEIGREINTIGAKANDAAIQRQVVSMKEDLEKIKEQTLNVL